MSTKQYLNMKGITFIEANLRQISQIRRLEIDEFVEYPPDKDKNSIYKTYIILNNGSDIGYVRLNLTPPDYKELYYGRDRKLLLSTVSNSVGVSGFYIYPSYRNMGIGRLVLLKLQSEYDKIYYSAGDEKVTHLISSLGFYKFMDGHDDGIHSHWLWSK